MNERVLDVEPAQKTHLDRSAVKLPPLAEAEEPGAGFEGDGEGVPVGADAVARHGRVNGESGLWAAGVGVGGDQGVEGERGRVVEVADLEEGFVGGGGGEGEIG